VSELCHNLSSEKGLPWVGGAGRITGNRMLLTVGASARFQDLSGESVAPGHVLKTLLKLRVNGGRTDGRASRQERARDGPSLAPGELQGLAPGELQGLVVRMTKPQDAKTRTDRGRR
jgi:hypothetical protein